MSRTDALLFSVFVGQSIVHWAANDAVTVAVFGWILLLAVFSLIPRRYLKR